MSLLREFGDVQVQKDRDTVSAGWVGNTGHRTSNAPHPMPPGAKHWMSDVENEKAREGMDLARFLKQQAGDLDRHA